MNSVLRLFGAQRTRRHCGQDEKSSRADQTAADSSFELVATGQQPIWQTVDVLKSTRPLVVAGCVQLRKAPPQIRPGATAAMKIKGARERSSCARRLVRA